MQVMAVTKYVRISSWKTRDIAQEIQGRTVSEALKITEFSERRAAFYIGKTLKSAIANAENNAKLSADELRIKEAVFEEGPAMKRFWPRARGMDSRIRKRTSHVRVILTDGAVGA